MNRPREQESIPGTGLPTTAAQKAQSDIALKNANLDLHRKHEEAYENGQISLQQYRKLRSEDPRVRSLVNLFNRHPDSFTDEDRQALADELKIPELNEATDPRLFKENIRADGTYQRVNVKTNQAEQTLDENGNPVKSLAGQKAEDQKKAAADRLAESTRTHKVNEGLRGDTVAQGAARLSECPRSPYL